MARWLMKTEPEELSIDELARRRVEPWTGVRNFVARNFMRAMAIGDDVLIYHSSCEPPGVAGLARVSRVGVEDPTQFDPASVYYDPKSPHDAPRWDCVEVEYVATLPHFVPLYRLRADRALGKMMLFTWSRLSVMPVSDAQFARIVELAQTPAPLPPPVAPRPRKPRASRKPSTSRAAKGRPTPTPPRPPPRRANQPAARRARPARRPRSAT